MISSGWPTAVLCKRCATRQRTWCVFTVHVSVIGHGVDLLIGQNLYMLAAGPAVELVDADQPAAHMVRHFALLAYMLREIRRGLIGYLSEIRRHHNHQYSSLVINLDFIQLYYRAEV